MVEPRRIFTKAENWILQCVSVCLELGKVVRRWATTKSGSCWLLLGVVGGGFEEYVDRT